MKVKLVLILYDLMMVFGCGQVGEVMDAGCIVGLVLVKGGTGTGACPVCRSVPVSTLHKDLVVDGHLGQQYNSET